MSKLDMHSVLLKVIFRFGNLLWHRLWYLSHNFRKLALSMCIINASLHGGIVTVQQG